MPRNVTSLLNHITLSITSSNLSSYLSYFFSFLSKNNTSSISFFSFNNYFNLCSFISSKLYALFNKEKDDLLSKEKFIDGMVSLYLSNIDSKATMIFNLCDFDNDGVIKRDDVKMIITHFHFMTKNTDVSIPIKLVDTFFCNSDTLTLTQFYNTVKSKSSDLIFLILFYLYHYKPFTQNEVDFFIAHMSHRKLSSISLSSYDTFQDIADISELLIEYINTNFNYEFEYESVDEDDYSDLNDLLALEEDFNQIKEDSLSMSTMASPVKKTSDGSINEKEFVFQPLREITHSAKNMNSFISLEEKSKIVNKSKFLYVAENGDVNQKNSDIKAKFSSEGYIAFDDQMCDNCNISIVDNMMFISLSMKKMLTVLVRKLFIQKQTISQKKKKKIIKTFIQNSKIDEMNTIEIISGLNNFITFKLSFKSITTANEFIEVIEESNNRKDIKEEFLLGEVIGEGGFAKVKKAYNKLTKEICAVKIINKFQRNNSQKRMTCNDDIDNMKFIISEVDVCRILMNYTPKHDNIVCIYGIYETFFKVYLVMKYIPSGSLDFLIEKRFTSLSLNDKYYISSQLSSAVSFLHSLNIMHRDIKASNVLIDSNLKV